MQLIVSTVLLLGLIYFTAYLSFPEKFLMKIPNVKNPVEMNVWTPYLCSILGLVSGMFIAAFTEYVTSHSYMPVR